MIKHKRKHKITIFEVIIYFVMVLCLFVFLYPFWQSLVNSLMTNSEAMEVGLKLWPKKITFDSYKFVFKSSDIYLAFYNTLWRTVIGTLLSVTVCYFAAYALTKKELPFRNVITILVIFTMFFDGGLIARFILIKNLKLLDSRWALVLPMVATAWNIIIARNFLSTLPMELEESAIIDGANPFVILFKIFVPLSMPIISLLILWISVSHWNAWFDAMIYTPKPQNVVLQLYLRRMIVEPQNEAMIYQATSDSTTQETIKSATIMVAMIPILCVYPFLQKHFVKGVMIGALKG